MNSAATEQETPGTVWPIIWFTLFALVSLAGTWLLITVFRSGRLDDAPYPNRIYLLIGASALVTIGLLGRRKWAALAFLGISSIFAVFILLGVAYAPWPASFVEIAVAFAFLLPAIVTWQYWPALRWRGPLGL